MGDTQAGGAPAGSVPPPQHNLQTASDLAFDALAGQSSEQLQWLGAEQADGAWRLGVLDAIFRIDPAGRSVRLADGPEVRPWWRVLALHYLGVTLQVDGAEPPPEVTFGDLPAARAYAGVYRQRVNQRLTATAGRDRQTLLAAAAAVGAAMVEGAGDLAFDVHVFPRLKVRLIWHDADEEFGPSATLLLPANIEALLCIEDIVVMSERLVARLSGGAF